MPPDPKDVICPNCGGPKSKQGKRCAKCAGEGHTPEQRDKHALCDARKKDGSRCRAFAGQGTDHPGVGLCKYHGGATMAHRTHAVTIEAKRRMVTFGQPIEDVTAPGALMGLLRASAGHVAWLQQEVASLDTLAGHDAQVLVNLYDSERDRLTRVGEACVRAGVAEHLVRMEQAQVATTLTAIRDAARDAGLNKVQLQALGVALRKRLAEQGGDPERAATEASAADAKLAELRTKVRDDEERRVSKLADRRARELSGLTFPPEELLPADSPPAA
jgi:hypothetical protein